jgi:hypothetical protein
LKEYKQRLKDIIEIEQWESYSYISFYVYSPFFR